MKEEERKGGGFMTVLPAVAPGVVPAPPPAVIDLHVHDTLAAGNRLWVRGRLTLPPPPPVSDSRAWWRRWRRLPPPPSPNHQLRVQTEVAGETLAAGVPLRPDGTFDALFEVTLPAARRGWRVARNHVTLGATTARACSVVLEPPPGATAGTLVVLPLACTWEPGGIRRLSQWLLASPLADLLRRRQQGNAPGPVYYLAAVAPDAGNIQPEFALLAASLGWPAGPLLPVIAPASAPGDGLAEALDRLRWLLEGRLDLLVVNAEPVADETLSGAARPLPDRALVSRFVRADEDLRDVAPAPGTPAHRLPERPVRPTRARSVPRYPLVFCHGMLAMTMLRMQIPRKTNYFIHLRPFLDERGARALFPDVEPTGGVAARAGQLRDEIVRWTDEPVNLIAHSMGGLDARFLISRLGLAGRVASLTTIATPHRGSALADWFCDNFRLRVPLLLTLEAFGVNVDGFAACRPAACREFNEQTPDAPGVRYFSYTAAVAPPRITPLLRRAWNLLTPLEGPNDGIVSVASARWGEELGTLAVDHFAQTPDGLFVRPDENFDALGFYARLVEDLARRGL
jgi:triacylglycerol lipase